MGAPLPTGASVNVVPQAPIVDPSQFRANPADTMASINSGLDLGQRMARLGDLQQQIKLEQLKRKSEMAQLTHAQALAEHETELIPQEMAARKAAAQAAELTSQNTAATQGALSHLGVPATVAAGTASQAENILNQSVASADFMKLSPEQQEAAKSIAALGIARQQGEDLPTWLERGGKQLLAIKTTAPTRVQKIMPDGSTHEFLVPTNTVTGAPLGPGNDLGETAVSPGAKSQAKQTKEYNDISADITNIDSAIEALDTFDKAGKAGQWQRAMATMATTPLTDKEGKTSIFSLAAGSMKSAMGVANEAPETKQMRSMLGRVSAGDIKDKYGSVFTPSEQTVAASFIPTVDKATTDPKAAMIDLINYKKFMVTKRDQMASGQAAAALAPKIAGATAPAQQAAAPVNGEVRYSGATPYRFDAAAKQWVPVN